VPILRHEHGDGKAHLIDGFAVHGPDLAPSLLGKAEAQPLLLRCQLEERLVEYVADMLEIVVKRIRSKAVRLIVSSRGVRVSRVR
jgi:hypothetical protein